MNLQIKSQMSAACQNYVFTKTPKFQSVSEQNWDALFINNNIRYFLVNEIQHEGKYHH